MPTEVVSVTSRIPDRSREPYYRYETWLESLRRLGVEPTVLGMNEAFQGLMTKPRRLREWLRAGNCKSEYLIVCDSYDVVFVKHPNEIGNLYNELFPGHILFNCERGLFPRGDLAQHFPDPGTPFRYLNSGFFIGTPELILALLETMLLDDLHDDYQHPDGRWTHVNDQGWYQVGYALQCVPQVLDVNCEIAQCLSACALEEFDLTGPAIVNRITRTSPGAYHFNGGSKNDLMPLFLEKIGLPA